MSEPLRNHTGDEPTLHAAQIKLPSPNYETSASTAAIKPKWYKRPRYIIPILFLALILAVAGALLATALYFSSRIQHVPVDIAPAANPGTASVKKDAEAVNFLVLGSDSRHSGGDPTNWEYGAQRSDTMMIVHISGDHQTITAMSIPRDSWVDIPGYGKAKINAAFSYGGAELTIKTVENLLGIHIDQFAVVDFEGFKQITDLLGGVTINTTQGAQTLTGEQALAFVRERKSLPNGDFDRARRQQAWMRAILANIKEKKILNNPDKLVKLADAALTHSAVDQNLNLLSLMQLAGSLRPTAGGNVQFILAPIAGTGWSPDGTQAIVNLDMPLTKELGEAWASDKLKDFLTQHPEIKPLGDTAVY